MRRRQFIKAIMSSAVGWPLVAVAQRRNVAMAENVTVKNLGEIFDDHVRAEFVDKDVAATMATMVPELSVPKTPSCKCNRSVAGCVNRYGRRHRNGGAHLE
jgi:hypothetical protein